MSPSADPVLVNKTAGDAVLEPLTPGDPRLLTLIVKRAFKVGLPEGSLSPAEERVPLSPADEPMGEEAPHLARYESDYVPFKPRADALCTGRAWGAGGRPVREVVVGFGVGEWIKRIRVVGHRFWETSLGGLRVEMTEPEPFAGLEISYANAYGGIDPTDPGGHRAFFMNPAGKGYTEGTKSLVGLPLPNLEDPGEPIRRWKDRRAPLAFGPVGRTWAPRARLAGTFDERWEKGRRPLPPADFDEGFYNAAPPNQQIEGYLRGDERVVAENLHPVHSRIEFRLPGLRVRGVFDEGRDGGAGPVDLPVRLDTLWLDMDRLMVVLVWRARFDAGSASGGSIVLAVEEPMTAKSRPAGELLAQLGARQGEEGEGEVEHADALVELEALSGES